MSPVLTQIVATVSGSEPDAAVIERIAAAQRAELGEEIEGLKVEAERVAGEARELVGEVPF
ncbi:MAG: hypothetical protein K9N23_16825 [Akkermansiaceae bacterium]|nr:hypothetical protein [Akkermansiaceae bacterium]MCF7733356.1 hypothetical protein [Akkermansiaceae bacterium]